MASDSGNEQGGVSGPSTGDRNLSRVRVVAFGAIAYTAAVLIVDTLAEHAVQFPFDWSILHRHVEVTIGSVFVGNETAQGLAPFNTFKFVAWLLIPLMLTLRTFDLGWFGVRRWKKADLALLAALVIAGAGAVALIPFFPSLTQTYPGFGGVTIEDKWAEVRGFILWELSWLVGWEFLLRYFLLRYVAAAQPRFGWLCVPAFEFLYHLQKPLLEAFGAGGLGIVLTWWALKRRNVLLPFLVHLSIESALLVYLLLN